jgi:exonuclease III
LIHKTKGLFIIHLNVQSLVKKIEQIRIFCTIYKPHLLSLTETWLNTSHTDFELNVSGYEIFRCDRTDDRRGGGALIYSLIDRNYDLERVHVEKNDIEFVTLKLKYKHSHCFYVTSLYCPPNSTELIKNSLLESFNDILCNECIFIGDFNLDLKCTEKTGKWLEGMRNNNFNQLICESTRITKNSSTIIDHIYTNDLKNISGSGVLSFSISDHQPIYF